MYYTIKTKSGAEYNVWASSPKLAPKIAVMEGRIVSTSSVESVVPNPQLTAIMGA